jgi:uncharacterized lipoprotein
MSASPSTLRPLLLGLVAVAMVSQSGCVWLRAKFGQTAVYEDAPQVAPLEVPPDLDVPATAGAVIIPDVTPNPITQGGAAAAPVAAAATGFTLADTVESSFRRVGVALGKIDGVVLGSSADNTHAVTFQGTPMLIRVEAAGDATRVFAVDTDGAALSSAPAATLLGLLKARLG